MKQKENLYEGENKSIWMNPAMTKVRELVDKDIKAIIIVVYCYVKIPRDILAMLSRDVENIFFKSKN